MTAGHLYACDGDCVPVETGVGDGNWWCCPCECHFSEPERPDDDDDGDGDKVDYATPWFG